MLTPKQEEYLAKIPEDAVAVIKPWDPKAANYAKAIVKQIEHLGLEAFWEGSLALEILGENDIDLYIFSARKDFSTYLPGLTNILAEPTYILPEKILWRIKKDGHRIDATLTDKNNPEVLMDRRFYTSLKENPQLLQEYVSLKIPRLSMREYYTRKNEFYNRITGNK